MAAIERSGKAMSLRSVRRTTAPASIADITKMLVVDGTHQRVRELIQSALYRVPVLRPRRGRRQRLRGGIADRRNRRRDRRGCGGSRRRRFVLVLVRDELFVARGAGARRNVLGHAAGPGRPTVGDISGERRACPELQTGAEHYRCSDQPLDHSGRQKLRLDGSDLWFQSTIIIADRPALIPPAPGKSSLHGGTVSAPRPDAGTSPRLLSLWYQ